MLAIIAAIVVAYLAFTDLWRSYSRILAQPVPTMAGLGLTGARMFAEAVALGVALVVVLLWITAPARAAETVDLRPVVEQLTSVAVEIVVSLLGIVGLWLAMKLKQKWGIDIEAQVRAIEAMHRDTLHSAVETWANAALSKFGPDLKITTDSAALAFILKGVKSSAPEAIASLGASEDWIINKAAGVLGVSSPVIQPN